MNAYLAGGGGVEKSSGLSCKAYKASDVYSGESYKVDVASPKTDYLSPIKAVGEHSGVGGLAAMVGYGN